MAEAHRNGVVNRLDEDQARRLISHVLAKLLARGTCTIRVRRLADEDRLTFLGGSRNHWQFDETMEYHGAAARQIAETLRAIGPKRSKDMHIQRHSNGNREDITIGFHKDAVTQHRHCLADYVMGQLFWD
jgi:hypothetical protein